MSVVLTPQQREELLRLLTTELRQAVDGLAAQGMSAAALDELITQRLRALGVSEDSGDGLGGGAALQRGDAVDRVDDALDDGRVGHEG
ncbi:hypothetical protein F4553_003028 [Allocatelliglobosispora scoriae]|uniref:Uncharacterized protein n=1 Tax=Allocatelliglobosispora scoriae TaxID=643052 RepID=A0A841BR29_9ACTN|nr:hypothetical protein [Allocatelliglobosispora scoriae]